jgi:hypothetical protein
LRRKLFTILAALSLLLCVATAVLWVRSYPYARVYQRDRVVYTIVKGSVDCRKFPPSDKRIEPEQASYFRRFGISYERRTPIYSPADASWAFKCPTAYPLGAFGVCPALWLLTYTKRPKTTEVRSARSWS